MKKLEVYKLNGSKFVVYLMVGIPGSGKSTWIKENLEGLPVISRDIIRAKLGFTESVDEKAVLSGGQEKQVTTEEHFQIAKLCKKKQNFVIDDTNTGRYRKDMISFLKSYGATVVGVNMETPLELCIERRRGQIPETAMRAIHRKLIPLGSKEVDDIINVKGY